MKKILLLITLLSFIAIHAKDEIVIKQNVQSLVQHGDNEGTNFFVAFPYNDYKQQPTQNIAIYVTSRFDTEVTVYNETYGQNITKSVKAYEITEFSDVRGGLSWVAEIYDFEKAIDKGFNVSSKDPIKVYVLNSKSVTSEGYMASPVRKWGTEYIHNSFYDFDEVREWAGGFVVLASEDNTEIKINLVDGANRSPGFGVTTGGKQHGDSIIVTLNRGEVYAVQGDGNTRGTFDLSGSRISSDKPIGLISYHNRTMIPATVVSTGRDYIVEMIPPVSSWGTEYHSVEIDRNKDKGDLFRVVAGEDNTTFNVTWFDKETKENISQIGPITLQEKGDWFEYNGTGANAPHDLESIRGTAHFTADGPIMVNQYSYSANYDGAGGNFDPFMIVLPAVGQYTKDCIFQTPKNYTADEFRNNFLNLIALGDANDSTNNHKLLNSLELDFQIILDKHPDFEFDNIPGTDYYWIRIDDLSQGSHRIIGDTEFGATIYGYASFDSYGWPVTHNVDDLVNTDTTSPGIVLLDDNDKYIFKVSDKPQIASGLNSTQADEYSVGLNSLPQLMSGSINFTEPKFVDENGNELATPEWINQQEYFFSVEVIDKSKDATAILKILDKNYNETEVAIYHTVPNFTIESNSDGLIKGRVGQETTVEIKVSNEGESELEIGNAWLLGDTEVTLSNLQMPIIIPPNAEDTLKINFIPSVEYSGESKTVINDTLAIEIAGNISYVPIKATGINPSVELTNFTFKKSMLNDGIKKEIGAIRIKNNTKEWEETFTDLIISSIKFDENSPNANLFSNLRFSDGENLDNFYLAVLNQGDVFELHFDLNTDLAEEPGMKFARLIIETDAGPADENGDTPVTINNYGVEFDGNFTTDNPTALDDGGYIQVEIVDSTQSSVTELTDDDIRILNPQPITGSKLNLELNEYNGSVITLSDVKGNVIQSLQTDKKQVSIDISNLTSGVYFINISDGKNSITKKILIER